MRISTLSTLLVAGALATSPSGVAFAAPAPTSSPTPARAAESTPPPETAVATEEEQYAAREAKDKDVANFQGGRSTIVIGGSTLGIVLLIILLVILL